MKAHRILLQMLFAITLLNLAACAKDGGTSESSVKAANVLTYQIATTDVNTGTTQVSDLAYVDFDKSRLVVADFNVCFRVISLDATDLAALREAMLYASSGQAQAQAACASSTDAYTVTQASTSLAVCGTDLKDQLDAIMTRSGQRLCKALDF
jgi:hypothetical protein